MDKYISNLKSEINTLITHEEKQINMGNEQKLHILFENLKHAKRLMEKTEKPNVSPEINPAPYKSYFGDM